MSSSRGRFTKVLALAMVLGNATGTATCFAIEPVLTNDAPSNEDRVYLSPAASASSTLLTKAGAFSPSAVVDSDDQTAWCGVQPGKRKPSSTKFADTDYGYWWEADFGKQGATVGALHMRTGYFESGQFWGARPQEYIWVYQKTGETKWRKIPGTELSRARYQLIFRFEPLTQVRRARLLIKLQDKAPCLREVTFYEQKDARIDTPPWFLAVATWAESPNANTPRIHVGGAPFEVMPGIRQNYAEVTGLRPAALPADLMDEVWVGDLDEAWVYQEPAPAAILLSGSYQHFHHVDPDYYEKFFNFLRANATRLPTLGTCGGHQLIAMGLAAHSKRDFEREFNDDKTNQIIVSCSSVPEYKCGGLSPEKCCYEQSPERGVKRIVANKAAVAMPNNFYTQRSDMLFNLLPVENGRGMDAVLSHMDFVNPKRVYPLFDVLATYSNEIPALSQANPTLVHAMKLKGYPVYGTQIHWDLNRIGSCGREASFSNMERVYKNFLLIAMRKQVSAMRSSSRSDNFGPLFDLDRATMWCAPSNGREEERLEILFKEPTRVQQLVTVEGQTPEEAANMSLSYEYTVDGIHWEPLLAERLPLYEAQKNRIDPCKDDPLPGFNDRQSSLARFPQKPRVRGIRLNMKGSTQAICLREIMVL